MLYDGQVREFLVSLLARRWGRTVLDFFSLLPLCLFACLLVCMHACTTRLPLESDDEYSQTIFLGAKALMYDKTTFSDPSFGRGLLMRSLS